MGKRVPYIAQLGNMDCGLACLTMIFNYYGLKGDIVDFGIDVHIGRDGMSLEMMKDTVKKFGFKFAAYRYEYKQENLNSNIFPAILFDGSHYVVLEKRNKKGYYIIIDPSKGRNKLKFEELRKAYSDILIVIMPDEKEKTITRKKVDIKINRTALVMVGGLMLLMQAITLVVPLIVQNVIDGLSNNIIPNTPYMFGIVLLIICSYFLLSWIRQELILHIDMEIFKNLIFKMVEKLFKVDINFFEWHTAGDISNRFNNISQLNEIITCGITNVIIQVITSAICLFAMLYSSVQLTCVALFLALLQIVILMLINNKNLTCTKEYIYTQSILQSELVDVLGNMIEIKCMGMETAIDKNLKERYDVQIDSFKRKIKTNNLMTCFTSTINLIIPLIIYLVGSHFVFNGKITVGTLIAFVTLVGYFVAPFSNIVILLPSINAIKEILLRYKELINFRESSVIGTEVNDDLQSIVVDNISYSYGAINNVTIENISLDIRKGENIALIGISGSGKSTLIKVILGALQVQKGAVYMNGVNINDLSRKQIYSWFSIVTQTSMCLNGSIRKNVDIAGQFTDDEIWKALELAEVKDDVMGMPLKLDTVIGEDGQNISGGQRQRLAIARALISNTEVIIFDEATSNLDVLTEQKIYNNLKRSGKTQIIITHRLSSVYESDKIFVLNRGKIIESGTHEELITKKGWYYKSIQNTVEQ